MANAEYIENHVEVLGTRIMAWDTADSDELLYNLLALKHILHIEGKNRSVQDVVDLSKLPSLKVKGVDVAKKINKVSGFPVWTLDQNGFCLVTEDDLDVICLDNVLDQVGDPTLEKYR